MEKLHYIFWGFAFLLFSSISIFGRLRMPALSLSVSKVYLLSNIGAGFSTLLALRENKNGEGQFDRKDTQGT